MNQLTRVYVVAERADEFSHLLHRHFHADRVEFERRILKIAADIPNARREGIDDRAAHPRLEDHELGIDVGREGDESVGDVETVE